MKADKEKTQGPYTTATNTANLIYLQRTVRNSIITVSIIVILITVVIINQCYDGSTVYIVVANQAKLIYEQKNIQKKLLYWNANIHFNQQCIKKALPLNT